MVPLSSTQAPVLSLQKKEDESILREMLRASFTDVSYCSACSLVRMACIPLRLVPSFTLAKDTCFCFRTERTHARTVTEDPGAVSSDNIARTVCVGKSVRCVEYNREPNRNALLLHVLVA